MLEIFSRLSIFPKKKKKQNKEKKRRKTRRFCETETVSTATPLSFIRESSGSSELDRPRNFHGIAIFPAAETFKSLPPINSIRSFGLVMNILTCAHVRPRFHGWWGWKNQKNKKKEERPCPLSSAANFNFSTNLSRRSCAPFTFLFQSTDMLIFPGRFPCFYLLGFYRSPLFDVSDLNFFARESGFPVFSPARSAANWNRSFP